MEKLQKDNLLFIKKNTDKISGIDYQGILDYLKNNRELTYKNFANSDLTDEQRKHYRTLENNGQHIVAELEKLHALCGEQFGLTKCDKIRWTDGSGTKTCRYLCVPMKYDGYEDRKESISIFVEMITSEEACYRVSLDLKNDIASDEDIKNYHRHLELPLNEQAGLIYVTGSNELGRPYRLDESQDKIREKAGNREYGKVQIAKYIRVSDYPANEKIEEAILKTVQALLPYYDYVIDKKRTIEDMKLENKTIEFDKNTILYGPPGTGKTYSTAKYAVSICDGDAAPDMNNYSVVMKRYRELMDEHRIEFVTFHQSYGYEEFIEGIKPVIERNTAQLSGSDGDNSGDIKYDVVDGVFKAFCNKARSSTVINRSQKKLISDNAAVWKVTIKNEVKEDCFENNRVRINWEFDTDGAVGFVEDIQKGDIIITTDGSRTSITGIAIATADEAEQLDTDNNTTSRDVIWLAKDISENIKSINHDKMLHRKTVARVPNMSVADIISLAKRVNPQNDVLAQTKVEENKKPYVFVIDEINRGNISKIFGELITLIEDTKREGLEECIPAILPYSGDEFTVPNNVYILGTMNTADRSIALMDTALRRRFKFIEMLPDPALLEDVTVEADGQMLNIAEMLKIINERITYLFDREHTIGHAIFMSLIDNNSIDNLASIFSKSVIPLLQEYFYEDYEKIRIVLGDNAKEDKNTQFVVAEDIPKDVFEGDVFDEIDIPEKSYRIEYENFKNIQSYKTISKKL